MGGIEPYLSTLYFNSFLLPDARSERGYSEQSTGDGDGCDEKSRPDDGRDDVGHQAISSSRLISG